MTVRNDKSFHYALLAGIILFFVVLFGIASSRVISWDIFWQLQSGRYMWETGRVLDKDVFSLASDVLRNEHCWLHDLIFYAVYLASGYKGISLFKGVLIVLTTLLLVRTAVMRKASLSSILIAVPSLVFLSGTGWSDRPQLWTILFFAFFVYLFERQIITSGKIFYFIFPLTVIWVNLHAGAIIIFPLLLAYIVGLFADRFLLRRPLPSGFRQLVYISPLIPLMFFLTPSGKASWVSGAVISATQGQSTGIVSLTQNMDWAPWSFADGLYYPVSVAIVGSILLLNWRRMSFKDLFLLGGLAFMGFRLGRHIPFFLLASASVVPLYLDFTWKGLIERFRFFGTTYIKILLMLCTLCLIFWTARVAWVQYGFFETGLRTWHYPVGAADFIREEKLPGNIFHNYEWGGYLMWRLFPDYKVFWDGRQDSTEMFVLGNKIVGGAPEKDEILSRFEVNTIILSPVHYMTGGRQARILDPLRRDPAWVLVYAGEAEVIFVRASSIDSLWLQKKAIPDSRIDDVILGLTSKILEKSPGKFKAYGERAKVYLDRRDLRRTFEELERYVALAPPEKADREAVKIYYELRKRFKRNP